jgi:hypothetical protein
MTDQLALFTPKAKRSRPTAPVKALRRELRELRRDWKFTRAGHWLPTGLIYSPTCLQGCPNEDCTGCGVGMVADHLAPIEANIERVKAALTEEEPA